MDDHYEIEFAGEFIWVAEWWTLSQHGLDEPDEALDSATNQFEIFPHRIAVVKFAKKVLARLKRQCKTDESFVNDIISACRIAKYYWNESMKRYEIDPDTFDEEFC